jgi:hypothetical protein
MAGRKKSLPPDAKVVSLSLGGPERIVLSVLEARRHARMESGGTPSQIVADALWYFLEKEEGVSRKLIDDLIPAKPQNKSETKVVSIKRTV